MAHIGYDIQIRNFDADYYTQQSPIPEYNPNNNYNVGDKVRIGTYVYEMQDPANKTLDDDVIEFIRNKGIEDFKMFKKIGIANYDNCYNYNKNGFVVIKDYNTNSKVLYNKKLFNKTYNNPNIVNYIENNCQHPNTSSADIIYYGHLLKQTEPEYGDPLRYHYFGFVNNKNMIFDISFDKGTTHANKISYKNYTSDCSSSCSHELDLSQNPPTITNYTNIATQNKKYIITNNNNDFEQSLFIEIINDITPNNQDIWQEQIIPIKIGTIDELKMFNIYNNSLTKNNANEPLHIRIQPEADILVLSKVIAKQVKIGDFTFDLDCKQDKDSILPYTHITVAFDNVIELYNKYKDDKGYLDITLIPYQNTRVEIGNVSTTNLVDDGVTRFDIRQEYKNYNELQPDEWGNIEFGNKPIVGRYIIKVVATWEEYKYAFRRHKSFQNTFCVIDLLDNILEPDEVKEVDGLQVKKMLWLNRAYFENISTATIVKNKNVRPNTVEYNITARELV